MAKKQRRPEGEVYTKMGSRGAELMGLEPPVRCALSGKGNKYLLYISKGSNIMVVGFAATYAARKFLDILLADDELAKTRGVTGNEDTIIATPSAIAVRCDLIDEILDYEYSALEEQWELADVGGPDTSTAAMRFRSSSGEAYQPREEGEKPKRIPKEKKESAPKASRDGLISIAQIAADLKIEPREARGILRSQKIAKPDVGWAWSKNEVDNIKKILHDNKA